MEETRARAGGIQIGGKGAGGGAMLSEQPGALLEDPLTRLTRAKELHKAGVLSDAEFETTKAKLLAEL